MVTGLMSMVKSKERKPKKPCKPKQEHPIVMALREIYKDQEGDRELIIQLMYGECFDISERNLKTLRDYIR